MHLIQVDSGIPQCAAPDRDRWIPCGIEKPRKRDHNQQVHSRESSLKSIVRFVITAAAAAFVAAANAGGAGADKRALADENDGRNWAAYGRTHSEQRFSPLDQINADSVDRLGLAWSLDLDVHNSVTNPIAVDGVIYVAAGYSFVHAVDAATGKLLWRHDPEVAKVAGVHLRAGWGIRGLAWWKGRLYAGTQDGRLIALDAKTGKPVWTAQTVEPGSGMFISGAPRVYNGKVIIGNGGGDFMPSRGYVTAYDAEDGRQLWRFYTVPGNPADGFEDQAQEMAAATWTGEWWRLGGGGNVWNAITYDPQFNRVYIGTGNGLPWNPTIRSPGGGDNLFLASIVALEADTGEYAWHYQLVPGEAWDYDASVDIQLAEIAIDGKPRPVILHVSKNGFFYVIDRGNGRVISAEKLGKVTWAERIDLETGRPVEAPNARYEQGPVLLYPSFQGIRSWWPVSYSPLTGLVYVPANEWGTVFSIEGVEPKKWAPLLYTPDYVGMAGGDGDVPAGVATSSLVAWDPVAQRAAWTVPNPGAFNGGTLVTAGNLVFQGLVDGRIHAYAADSGKRLWSFFAGTAAIGSPITFSAGGRQYVAITAGPLGGTAGAFASLSAEFGWDARVHPRRLLAFTLDGTAKLPPTPPPARVVPLEAPEFVIDAKTVEHGVAQYPRCVLCHGPAAVAGGLAPDLRASPIPLSRAAFTEIVRGGSLESRGMPKFPELSDEDLEGLRHYIRSWARRALADEAARQ
jgi:quinohemoprotein ethanol dehydrogenase